MIPATDTLKAAIRDFERRPFYWIMADWDRDGQFQNVYSDISGFVTSVAMDRGCSTYSPDELNVANGYSSGEITFELGGQRDTDQAAELTAYQLFGGGPAVSPLWGQSALGVRIHVWTGFATASGALEWVPTFTGWIRELSVSRKARTVHMVANDNADMVNSLVTLPLWATGTSSPYATWQNNNPDVARSILLSWVWEETLRQCGRHVAPVLRDDCQAHYTCSGSLLPSVGHITDAWATGPFVQAVSFVPENYAKAPFGWGLPRTLVRGSDGHCNARTLIRVPSAKGPALPPVSVSFGVWVETDEDDTTADIMSYMMFMEGTNLADDFTQADRKARVVMSVTPNGKFASAVVGGLFGGNIGYNRADSNATRSGWHYYSATIDITTRGITHTLSVDGVKVDAVQTKTTDLVSFSDSGEYPQENRTNLVRLVSKLATHHAQLWVSPVDSPTRFAQPSQLEVPLQDNGAPQVALSRSLTELSWIPDVQAKSGWEVLKETVGAEWGGLWMDAYGTVHLASRPEISATTTHSIGLDNPVYGDDVVGEITLTPRADTKRNTIIMPGKFRNAVEKIVWTNQNAHDYRVARGQYIDGIQYALSEVPAVMQKLDARTAEPPANDADIDVRISSASAIKADSQDEGASRGWAFNLRQDHNQRSFYLSLHAEGEDDFIGAYKKGNRPSMMVAGRVYSDVQPITYTTDDPADVSRWGRRVWTVDESDWRQTQASLQALTVNMLETVVEGTIGISDVEVPHDPTREIFDVVVIANDSGEGLGKLVVQVMGINSSLGSNGFRDTLSLRLLYRPGVAMWDNVAAGWETAWSE